MNQQEKRHFLNSFFKHHLRPFEVKPKDYITLMEKGLKQDPMDADWQDIHRVQRQILRDKGLIK